MEVLFFINTCNSLSLSTLFTWEHFPKTVSLLPGDPHEGRGSMSLVHHCGPSTWRGTRCEWMGIKQLLNALMFAEDRDNNKMVIVLLGEACMYAIIQYTQVHTYSASHSFVTEGEWSRRSGGRHLPLACWRLHMWSGRSRPLTSACSLVHSPKRGHTWGRGSWLPPWERACRCHH